MTWRATAIALVPGFFDTAIVTAGAWAAGDRPRVAGARDRCRATHRNRAGRAGSIRRPRPPGTPAGPARTPTTSPATSSRFARNSPASTGVTRSSPTRPPACCTRFAARSAARQILDGDAIAGELLRIELHAHQTRGDRRRCRHCACRARAGSRSRSSGRPARARDRRGLDPASTASGSRSAHRRSPSA